MVRRTSWLAAQGPQKHPDDKDSTYCRFRVEDHIEEPMFISSAASLRCHACEASKLLCCRVCAQRETLTPHCRRRV